MRKKSLAIIALFGTGKVYGRYENCIDHSRISCFIDNDASKSGTIIKGVPVLLPEDADLESIPYILVMTDHYKEIRDQLINMGVDAGRIRSYRNAEMLLFGEPVIYSSDAEMDFSSWKQEEWGRKAFLFSHDLDLSGACVACGNMARILSDIGFQCLVGSPTDGPLKDELISAGIDVVSGLEAYRDDPDLYGLFSDFDLIILNTITMGSYADKFLQVNRNILWWIHESDPMYYKGVVYDKTWDGIRFFGCSGYVNERLEQYGFKPEGIMNYYLPEDMETADKNTDENKDLFRIILIGSIEKRKAQDILIAAVEKLTEAEREQIEIHLIGRVFNQEYWENMRMRWEVLPHFLFMGVLHHDEIIREYSEADLLICSSRDDPMPIVVSEAMMNDVPCIISDRVGQAEYIENGVNGMVFENEDVDMLAEYIRAMLSDREKAKDMGKRSRGIYDRYFSRERIIMQMKRIVG